LKKAFFIMCAIWLGSSVANFAQMKSPEERAKQITERLKLTKDQEKKVEKIFQKQQEKMSKIVKQGDDFRDPSNREKMMKLREVYRHLSNAADRGDEAANVIADIVVKIA